MPDAGGACGQGARSAARGCGGAFVPSLDGSVRDLPSAGGAPPAGAASAGASGPASEAADRRRWRVCLVGQRYQLGREYVSIYDALARRFELTTVFVDDGWPASARALPDYQRQDACIWFVRFRELLLRPGFDWADYRGLRIMYDQDAYQNFALVAGDRFLGRWPEVFRRNEFDVLACTGRETRDRLRADGVPAHWIPKAYDRTRFFPRGESRTGVCYFGEPYRARAAMLASLRRGDVRFARFHCPYGDLNLHLNRYVGCLICNMEAHPRAGIPRLARRLLPLRSVRCTTAPETMLKNFEVPGAGCAPICDDLPELAALGFEDGVTAVTYRTFDELVEKVRHYCARPERLATIGARAAELVRARHTWDHRAGMLAALIAGAEPRCP